MTARPSQSQALHGVQAAPPEVRALRTGGNTVLLEGIDLRYVRVGTFEAVRRIYVAVRDSGWATIPAEYRITRWEQQADTFNLELEAKHRADDLDFVWHGYISGSPDGTITYQMDGLARSRFQYNRIGLCVLLPIELRGARYRADAPDGVIKGVLPDLIGPQQIESGLPQPLFGPFNRLTIAHDGIDIQMELSGDLFEIEDQRNWTDASYKIYSTPLSRGFPHMAQAGQHITQTITIKPQGPERHTEATQRSSTSVGELTGNPLPAIGFAIKCQGETLSTRQFTRLQAVQPDHLRVDARLDRPLELQLRRAVDVSRRLGCPLEVAVFLDANDGEQLDRLVGLLRESVRIARFLIFDRTEQTSHQTGVTSRESMECARMHLGKMGVPLLGGTNLNFCELNRTHPDVKVMDGVVYPINPQVHADDDRSVTENVLAQAETVRTARAFAAGRPIVVSPITLKPQANPVVGQEKSSRKALPASVDPRQLSLLGAAWTLGSIASLAYAGASSLTYYETTGWKGLMEQANGSPLPDSFPSLPGMVFPLYHIFADVAELRHGRLVNCSIDHPLTTAVLAVQTGSSLHLLVANLAVERHSITCRSLPGSSASIRRLDLQSFRAAVLEPEFFRRGREKAVIQQGELMLDLGPYATLRIDLERQERARDAW